MLTTPHVLIGLTIAKIVPNPLLAIGLAILSHFLLDFFLPHWNPHLYTEYKNKKQVSPNSIKIIIIDGLLAMFFCFMLAIKTWPNLEQIIVYALVSISSCLPDLVEIPYYFWQSKNTYLTKYIEFSHKHQAKSNFWEGVLTQILIIIACLKQLFF